MGNLKFWFSHIKNRNKSVNLLDFEVEIISWMFTFAPHSQQVIQMSTDSMTMCTPNWNPYRFNFLHFVKTVIATNTTKQKRKKKYNKVSCRVMNAFRGSLPPFHLLLFLAVLISPSPSAFQCEKFKYFECRARLTTTCFCSDFFPFSLIVESINSQQ